MNYQEIYKSFIASRRALEDETRALVAEGEIVERHHIVPRCAGGDDSDGNLVYLRYRDHLFAHNLLARCYRDHPDEAISHAMWQTIRLMYGKYSVINPRVIPSDLMSRIAAAARKRRKKLRRPIDTNVYEIMNVETKEIKSGTRAAFVSELGLSPSGLTMLLQGKSNSHLGWCLPEADPNSVGNMKGERHYNFNPESHIFRKIGDNNVVVRTQYHFSKEFGVASALVSTLVRGKSKSANGWTLACYTDEEVGVQAGEFNPLTRGDKHCFVNVKDCSFFRGTWSEFRELTGKSDGSIAGIIRKGALSRDGWCLARHVEQAIERHEEAEFAARDKDLHELINIYTGDKRRLRRRQIREDLGLSHGQVSIMILRGGATKCGWTLEQNKEKAARNHIDEPGKRLDRTQYSIFNWKTGQRDSGMRSLLMKRHGISDDVMRQILKHGKTSRSGWKRDLVAEEVAANA